MPNPPSLCDRMLGLLGLMTHLMLVGRYPDQRKAPSSFLVITYFERVMQRFAAYHARFLAGTLVPPRPRPPRADDAPAPESAASESAASERTRPERMPTTFGWVLTVAATAVGCAEQLQYILREPDLHAMMERAPQMARLFRPLCRMLGMRAAEGFPALLLPPPRPRAPRAPRAPRPLSAKRREAAERAAAYRRDAALRKPSPGNGPPSPEPAGIKLRDIHGRPIVILPGYAKVTQ